MTEKFTFFWRNKSPFSQWYQGTPFTAHGILFRDAETYMMWGKDRLFGGTMEKEILSTSKPSEVKALGRRIPNFKQDVWDANAAGIVFKGNWYKFSQNPAIAKALFATRSTTLVEANPFDRIWGIGLSEFDYRALDRSTWLGKNWLGEVLTMVRDGLMRGEELHAARDWSRFQ